MNEESPMLSHPFPPVYDRDSRILILGSFPSVKSREEGFYYANPRNRFWKMIECIFSVKLSSAGEKKTFLLRHHIALWDSIAQCRLHASSDSTITDVVVNDIPSLIKETGIGMIIANGSKAFDVYMKYIYPETGLKAVRLPSTSPANAAWTLEKLAEVWKGYITLT